MICENCKQVIKINGNYGKHNCGNCSVMNHCCPDYLTTANIKKCDFHKGKALLVMSYPANEYGIDTACNKCKEFNRIVVKHECEENK